MDFRKKLKTRLCFAIAYIVIGIAMIAASFITENYNEFLSPMGAALLIIGIARVRNHFLITKSDETVKKQQIAETDERNIAISNRAKSVAFNLYVLIACVAVIVLQFMEKSFLASTIGLTVCVVLLIYWISYFIISKKS